jgi:hypothetical protein
MKHSPPTIGAVSGSATSSSFSSPFGSTPMSVSHQSSQSESLARNAAVAVLRACDSSMERPHTALSAPLFISPELCIRWLPCALSYATIRSTDSTKFAPNRSRCG